MFNWFNLVDRLVVGVPMMIACVIVVLLMAYVEEHIRKARTREKRGKK